MDPSDDVWLRSLLDTSWDRMVRLASLLLGSVPEAEQVVEDSVVAVHQRRQYFESSGEAEVWLRTAVVNKCRAAHRSRVQAITRPAAVPPPDLDAVGDPNVHVIRALRELPQRQTEVLVLRHWLGLAEGEVADVLGISLSAVKTHAERGLSLLASKLGREAEGANPDPDAVQRTVPLLTRALEAEAAQVRPHDAHERIVERVAEPVVVAPVEPTGRFRWIGGAAILLLVLGTLAPIVWHAARGNDTIGATPTPSTASSVAASGPPSLPTVQRRLALYYTDRLGRLVVEWRDLPTQGDRLTTAVQAVLNVAPADPAYTSEWAGGQVKSAKVLGDVIVLDLSESAFGGFTNRAQAQLAIQQVVYTATAVVGDSTGVKSVQVLINGSPNLPFLGAPHENFARNGNKPLAPMWISTPVAGSVVDTSSMANGQVQATVPQPVTWAVHEPGVQQPVASGVVMSSQPTADGWSYWAVPLKLPKGDYTLHISVVGLGSVERGFTVR